MRTGRMRISCGIRRVCGVKDIAQEDFEKNPLKPNTRNYNYPEPESAMLLVCLEGASKKKINLFVKNGFKRIKKTSLYFKQRKN